MPNEGVTRPGTGLPRLLIAGFGAFPGVPENPSAEMVGCLAARWAAGGAPGGAVLETHILRTEYRAVDRWVASRLSEERPPDQAPLPDLFLLLGYSSLADRLKIETHGSNMLAPHLPDAAGICPDALDAPILHRYPTLPFDSITAALRAADIDHMLSDNCGEYVCNYSFFSALAALDGSRARAGFVHLPPVDFGEGRVVPEGTARARPADELARGIEIIARESLAHCNAAKP